MDQKKILDALRSLDVDDDAQWTNDDQPKLDVIRQLTGDKSVTREALVALAPEMTRQTFDAWLAGLAPEDGGGEGDIEAQDPAAAEAEAAPTATTEELADLDALISIALDEETEARNALESAKSVLAGKVRAREALEDQRNAAAPPPSQGQMIQQYIERSNAQRMARVTGMRVTAPVAAASSLDAAFQGRARQINPNGPPVFNTDGSRKE